MKSNGNIRYHLKTPYRDGTTHVIFEPGGLPPLDFIASLAALVPKPRANLTRLQDVFAPNSKHRALATLAKRCRGSEARVIDEPPTPVERRASLTWAQSLKRVFNWAASDRYSDVAGLRRDHEIYHLHRRSCGGQADPVCRPSAITLSTKLKPVNPVRYRKAGDRCSGCRWAV